MSKLRLLISSFLIATFLAPVSIFAQTQAASDDPLMKTSVPSAVTLSATYQQTLGSKRGSGSVTLKATSDGAFAEQWSSESGSRSIQATAVGANRVCSSVNERGVTVEDIDVSCMRIVPWFAPWIAPQLSLSNAAVAADAGRTPSLDATERASVVRKFVTPTPNETKISGIASRAQASLQAASAVTIYYDPLTNLPRKYVYQYPVNSGSTIEIAVDYSDYRDEGGYMLPHHMVRSIQKTVELDVQVSSATPN